MAKKPTNSGKITNKRARFDYAISEEMVAGLVLNGRETKSLRLKHGHLRGAFVAAKDGEFWLMNATITSPKGYEIKSEEQTLPRKLLLKKKEIAELKKAKDESKSIIPLEIITKSRFIKVKIGLGKGRKKFDKRSLIQKRDLQREAGRTFKNNFK